MSSLRRPLIVHKVNYMNQILVNFFLLIKNIDFHGSLKINKK